MYEDTPDDIVHDLLSKAIYENHPLGYPILGTEETLQTFTGDTLKQYIHVYIHLKMWLSRLLEIFRIIYSGIEKYFGSYEGSTSEDKKMKSGIP